VNHKILVKDLKFRITIIPTAHPLHPSNDLPYSLHYVLTDVLWN